ncbi:MAG: hypothetical protein ACKO34_08420 [Vampirovibrionales bacterium]
MMSRYLMLQDLTQRLLPYMQVASLKLNEAHTVTSTNDWAWEAYRDTRTSLGENQSLLFLALVQTKGRGTQNRVWMSPEGAGLYMSLLYIPKKQIPLRISALSQGDLVPIYSRVVALATWYALVSLFPALCDLISVRGANDLCVGLDKLGGHLVETSLTQSGYLNAIVVGTGLNVSLPASFHLLDERNTVTQLSQHVPADELQQYNLRQLAYLIGLAQAAFCSAIEQGALNDLDYYIEKLSSPHL